MARFAPRTHVLLARKASLGLVIRRGPSQASRPFSGIGRAIGSSSGSG